MNRATRWALLLSAVVIAFVLVWDFTPSTAGSGKSNLDKPAAGNKEIGTRKLSFGGVVPAFEDPAKGKTDTPTTLDPDNEDAEDPDLPPGMAGTVDKEAYLRARGEYVDMLRGREGDAPAEARESAIKQMERQEGLTSKLRSNTLASFSSWTFLGPAPIPNGQTSSVSSPVSGRTISIAVHPTNPDIVYVGTAQGGLYKSTNGGANWTPLFDFVLESLAIGAITIDPNDSNIVYVGTGENGQCADCFAGRGMYIIRNANSSPTISGPFRLDGVGNDVFNGRAIGRILVNPGDNNVIFVCTSNGTGGNPNTTTVLQPPRGIYRSVNAQSPTPTFEKVQITPIAAPGDRTVIDMAMDPVNPNLLIATVIGAASDGGIYRTANALAATPTFTRTLTLADGATNGRAELTVTNNATAGTTFYTATGELVGGTVCTGANATRGGAVRRSTDGGLTWSTPLTGSAGFCGGQCFYDIAIAVTPDNQTIHLGGAARSGTTGNCNIDVMKRSTNGGTSFVRNDVGLHADEHALTIAPSNPNVVYTGSDGGIWRSTNNGTNWNSLNNADFSATQFQSLAMHPFDRYLMLGGTQDNGTNCLTPNGTTWSNCRGGDGGYTIFDDNAQDVFSFTAYHTFFNQTGSQIQYERTSNNGFAWTVRGCSGTATTNGISCTNNVLFYAPMAQGPGNPNTIYFGTDRLYRSTNRGDTHTIVSQAPLIQTGNVCVGTCPPNPLLPVGVVITSIGISPQDDNVRIVGMRTGRVFATTTGSSTLTEVTGSNFPAPNPIDTARNSIGEAIIDPNNKFTAYVSFTSFSPPAGQQIFKTTNLNSAVPTWTPSSNGIPQVPVSTIAIDPQNSNILYAGTDIGVYASTDGGANWSPLGTGLPRVAVFDAKINNVQRILRIATHGRGIWEIQIPGNLLPIARSGGATIVEEGCAPGNGAIDPGEDVTLAFAVKNIGPGPTSALTATLQANPDFVIHGSATQNYGIIAAGATATQNFKITASDTKLCGDTITLTFQIQDGATNFGTYNVSFRLGRVVNETFAQNFDGVTAPALPSGWTTASTGGLPGWTTVSDPSTDTLPNAAYSSSSATASDNRLDSPVVAVPVLPGFGTSQAVQLSFRNSYNTESTFDGGVLEISINGGPFVDILAAGGTFASGGYNGAIVVTDSVLTGRAAWTGNSLGFIETVVNLPAAAHGQNAQFRWRTAYDSGTNPPGGGIRIDTVRLYTVTISCCSGPCVITCPSDITTPTDPGVCGATVNFTPTYTGNCGVVTASPASGTVFPVGNTNVTVTGTRYDSTIADSCDFDVTVNDTELPVVSSPTTSPNTLWPPNHQMVDVTVNYTATDNCPLTCVLTVASSEAINGLGDGDSAPDWEVIDAHHLKLRSERSGKGKLGRTYTISTTCTDESSNTTVKTSTVFVPHSTNGKTVVIDGGETNLSPIAGAGPVLNSSSNGVQASGNGWIAVMPGSYQAQPKGGGKLSFDFNSKPINARDGQGKIPIELSLDKLKFSAMASEYQTISDSKVQFQGVGKVNGESGFSFILTVVDGQAPGGGGVDKFRLKIWNKSTGAVVFDTQSNDGDDADPTTAIRRGTIVIQK